MTDGELWEIVDHALVRIVQAVHLPTFYPDGDLYVEGYELFCEVADDVGWPKFDDIDEASEFLTDNLQVGWIVMAITPVPTFTSLEKPKAFTFSWGHGVMRYFYAKSYEDVVKKAALWAESYRAERRAEWVAEQRTNG